MTGHVQDILPQGLYVVGGFSSSGAPPRITSSSGSSGAPAVTASLSTNGSASVQYQLAGQPVEAQPAASAAAAKAKPGGVATLPGFICLR